MNSPGTRVQAGLIVLGALVVGYGGLEMLQLLVAGTAPVLGVGSWWLGGPLIVDLAVVPIVVLVGIGLRRFVPAPWRRPTSAALVLTFLLSLVAFPFLTGLGRRADNPSLLDRNYWVGFLILVAIIWGLALVVILVGRVRTRRTAGRV